MAKAKKGAVPSTAAGTAEVLVPVAKFTTGLDAGEAIAGATFALSDIGARMAVTIGKAYDPAKGFPAWKDLDEIGRAHV